MQLNPAKLIARVHESQASSSFVKAPPGRLCVQIDLGHQFPVDPDVATYLPAGHNEGSITTQP